MYLELENKLAIIDLRTKEDVLDYIKNYGIYIISCGDEVYHSQSLHEFKQETGMSDEHVVDMLFDKESNEDEMFVEESYTTDYGDTRVFEPIVGEISYFEYEECSYEPGYPYINKISEDEFYSRIKTMKEFLTKLDTIGGNNNASK